MSLRCGKGGSFMEKLEIRMQEELFDVETKEILNPIWLWIYKN